MILEIKTGPTSCFPPFFSYSSGPGYGLWWLGPLIYTVSSLLLSGLPATLRSHSHAFILAEDIHDVSFLQACRLGVGLICD